MSGLKWCEHRHPDNNLLCERERNHLAKCVAYDKDGKRFTWQDPSEGPDALKSLLRF